MSSRQERLNALRRVIERKVDAIDERLTATERLLAERQAAVDPASPELLPILRPRRARKTS